RCRALDAGGEFGECDSDSVVYRQVDGKFVVPAAQVLHERVTGRDRGRRPHLFESPHRSKPCFEPTMIRLYDIVGVLLQHVAGTRSELVDDTWVDRRPVSRDLDWCSTEGQRVGEERSGSCGVAAFAD